MTHLQAGVPGRLSYVLRSVGAPVQAEGGGRATAWPLRSQTLECVLDTGFGGCEALVAPIGEGATEGGTALPSADEQSSMLAFLRQHIGARTPAKQTAGLSRYFDLGCQTVVGKPKVCQPAGCKKMFLASVAAASGVESVEVAFAEKALLNTGAYEGCLVFETVLGRGSFGQVTEATRKDFPDREPFALKTISKVNHRNQSLFAER